MAAMTRGEHLKHCISFASIGERSLFVVSRQGTKRHSGGPATSSMSTAANGS